jgi:heme oxygenase
MLADQLKTDTLENHQQLEKMLVVRMKAIRSAADYANLLQLFYSYFGGLEEKIDQYIGNAELPDYNFRRKSESLANDVKALGAVPGTKASGDDLPEIGNRLQAFAAMYVIEGSTLGGKYISKMMAQQLSIKDEQGLTFFSGYGDNTETMWESFKKTLNEQEESEDDAAIVISTANETFAKFKKWIEKQAA